MDSVQQKEVIYTRMITGHLSQHGSKINPNNARNSSSTFLSESKETDQIKYISSQVQTTPCDIEIKRLTSSITEEESNFLRFCHLVQTIAPRAVRCRFDQEFPPNQLEAIIQRNLTLLMDLKDQRVITKAQWRVIFPYGAKVTSADFDITLMMCFFRHFYFIAPQKCDFDTLPLPCDNSLEADLARIKYYRNYISHCLERNRKLNKTELINCWETVSKAISRIGGQKYDLECSNLLEGTLDPSKMNLMITTEQGKQFADHLPPNVRENIQNMMNKWVLEDASFVETDTSKVISEIMKTSNLIIVTGSQGSGKSFTVRHVLLLLKKEGYDIIPVSSSSNVVKYFSKAAQQVFCIDDFCGKYNISSNNIEDYQQNKQEIENMFESCTLNKFIVICRLQIYNDPLFKNLHLDSFKVCDFSGSNQISFREKVLICKKYLPENVVKILSKDTIRKCESFPLLCSLYKSHPYEGILFFEQPKTYFETELNKLKHQDKIKYSCIALCVMYNDFVPFEIFNTESSVKTKQIFDAVFEDCEVNLATPKKTVHTQFECMVGSFFAKTEVGYKSIHDYMFNIYCNHFRSTMVPRIVEYADSRLIGNRALLQSIGQKGSYSDIVIPKELETKFFQRIKQDIIDCKIWDVFAAFQMKYKTYRVKLIEVLNSLDYDINQQDTHGCTPLFVSSHVGYHDILDIVIRKGGDVNICDKNGFSPLHAASEKGHTTILEKLYKIGGDATLCSTNGHSTLLIAAGRGHKDCVDFLLKIGVEANKFENNRWSPLFAASYKGHTAILEMLYNKEGDVNLCNKDGQSPLWAASYNGHKDCVDYLLQKGVDVNKCDNNGFSPLFTASYKGHTTILEIIYNRGGDAMLCNKDGQSPLLIASLNGHKDCVDFLLKKGVEVNKCDNNGFSPLFAASYKGHTTILEIIYNRGGDAMLCNKDGQSPLLIASLNGHKDCVYFLLDKGVEINKSDNDGFTPQNAASMEGHTSILEVLYNRGGDINQCNKKGISPLWAASNNGHKDCVEFLLQKRVETNKCNNNGQSPLFLASAHGHTDILEMLCNKGGDVNMCTNDGGSPLWVASCNGHKDCVKFLLNKQVEVNKCNNHGESPLFVASANGHTDILEMLCNKGGDVNRCTKYGQTPLLAASYKGHKQCVKFLLDKQIEVNKCNNDGESPLFVASANGHITILEMLWSKGGDVSMCTKDGQSPLWAASFKGHKDCVESLLHKHVEVNKCSNNGESPLFVASSNGHTDILEMLYNKGGDVSLCTKVAQSPLLIAALNGHLDCVSFLLYKGAEVNKCDQNGSSALFIASLKSNIAILEMLHKQWRRCQSE